MTKNSRHNDPVNDDELWNRVKRTATPLKKTAVSGPLPDTATSSAAKPADQAGMPKTVVKPVIRKPAPPPPNIPDRLDDTTTRKLAKGKLSIDSRLDLHGMTQAEAHDRLYGFLYTARQNGQRVVLVITGKGRLGGGILRSTVPLWFEEFRFRELVSGYREAHQSHGGTGALYVRLRRMR